MPAVPNPDGGGGGPGGGGLDPILKISPPTPHSIGAVSSATPTDFTVSLSNPGHANGDVELTSITFSDPQFTSVTALPVTVGATPVVFTLRMTPTSPGAKTCTMTFVNDGSVSQVHYTVTATAIDPTTQGIPKIVMSDPSLPIGQMPLTKVNTTSGVSIGVKNVGASAFNITAAVITAGGTWFVLTPAVTLPVAVNPGDTVFFPVTFTPDDIGVFSGNLKFTTDLLAPFDQVNVALSGLSVPFFPVSSLDNHNRVILLGFDGGELKYPLPNTFDYNIQDSVLEFNGALWEAPGQEKTIERLEVFYENLGQTTLFLDVTVLRPSLGPDFYDVITKSVVVGTALADETDRSAYVDITATGEIMRLTVRRLKSSGPVSLTAVMPHFADRGEKVENV